MVVCFCFGGVRQQNPSKPTGFAFSLSYRDSLISWNGWLLDIHINSHWVIRRQHALDKPQNLSPNKPERWFILPKPDTSGKCSITRNSYGKQHVFWRTPETCWVWSIPAWHPGSKGFAYLFPFNQNNVFPTQQKRGRWNLKLTPHTYSMFLFACVDNKVNKQLHVWTLHSHHVLLNAMFFTKTSLAVSRWIGWRSYECQDICRCLENPEFVAGGFLQLFHLGRCWPRTRRCCDSGLQAMYSSTTCF